MRLGVALAFLTPTLAGLAWACAPASPLLNDPYQIYARTRQAWMLQRYPQFISYTITVNVDENGVAKSNRYHALYDQANDRVHLDAVSDEEKADPPNPTGFTLHLQPKRQNQTIADKRVGNPGRAVDLLGVPLLAPNYSFGLGEALAGMPDTSDRLVAEIRREFDDPMPSGTAKEIHTGGQLKAIADVTSIGRTYLIRLDGVESIGAIPCYHLSLKPMRDPARFRLRDLWVDTQTYETRELLNAGNFTGSRVPWLITFAEVGGALYIASEIAQEPVGAGDHHYDRASITFADITQAQRPDRLIDSFVTKENVMTEPLTH